MSKQLGTGINFGKFDKDESKPEIYSALTSDEITNIIKTQCESKLDDIIIWLVKREQLFKTTYDTLISRINDLINNEKELQNTIEFLQSQIPGDDYDRRNPINAFSTLNKFTNKSTITNLRKQRSATLTSSSPDQKLGSKESTLNKFLSDINTESELSSVIIESDNEKSKTKSLIETTNSSTNTNTFEPSSSWEIEATKVGELFSKDCDLVLTKKRQALIENENDLFALVLSKNITKINSIPLITLSTHSFLPYSGFSWPHVCILLGSFDVLEILLTKAPHLASLTDRRGNTIINLFIMAKYLRKQGVGCEYNIEKAFYNMVSILINTIPFSAFVNLFDVKTVNMSNLNISSIYGTQKLSLYLSGVVDHQIGVIRRNGISLLHDRYCCGHFRNFIVNNTNSLDRMSKTFSRSCLRRHLEKELNFIKNTNQFYLLSSSKHSYALKKIKLAYKSSSAFIHRVCYPLVEDGTNCSWNILSPLESLSASSNAITKLRDWDRLNLKSAMKHLEPFKSYSTSHVYSSQGTMYHFSNDGLCPKATLIHFFLAAEGFVYRELKTLQDSVSTNPEDWNQLYYKDLLNINLLRNIENIAILTFKNHGDVIVEVNAKYVYLSALCRAMERCQNIEAVRNYTIPGFISLEEKFVYPIRNSNCEILGVIVAVRRPSYDIYGECMFIPTISTVLLQRFLKYDIVCCDLFSYYQGFVKPELFGNTALAPPIFTSAGRMLEKQMTLQRKDSDGLSNDNRSIDDNVLLRTASNFSINENITTITANSDLNVQSKSAPKHTILKLPSTDMLNKLDSDKSSVFKENSTNTTQSHPLTPNNSVTTIEATSVTDYDGSEIDGSSNVEKNVSDSEDMSVATITTNIANTVVSSLGLNFLSTPWGESKSTGVVNSTFPELIGVLGLLYNNNTLVLFRNPSSLSKPDIAINIQKYEYRIADSEPGFASAVMKTMNNLIGSNLMQPSESYYFIYCTPRGLSVHSQKTISLEFKDQKTRNYWFRVLTICSIQ